jgi:sterol-4alpha-carboxylate 3-dehydrogenase (decarboxylating)
MKIPMTTLVIGGGMLGGAIVRALHDNGLRVRVFDRVPFTMGGVESITGDIRDRDAVRAACAGVETVIHTVAAVSQAIRPLPAMYAINVTGTQHVIEACQSQGVRRLVYTSSIDVVFDGTPIADGDESLPYPARHLDYYGTTKMQAEQAVIAANGVRGLATCSLRMAGIYGAGDRYRFPSILDTVMDSGRYTRIGDGKAKFGHVYVENAAHAHLLASERLTLDSPIAGQCYFINDHAPRNFWDFFPPFLDALGIRYTVSSAPYGLMRMIALISDQLKALRSVPPDVVPPSGGLSVYAVESTCKDFWFNHRKAARDLDYSPIIDEAEAFTRTVAWLRTWLANRPVSGAPRS